MKNRLLLFVIFAGLLLITSCSSNDDSVSPALYNNLVSADLFLTKPASELRTFVQIAGLNLPLEEMKYEVEIYKVSYLTEYKGEAIRASGLVILPDTGKEPVSMISFQRGTIAAHSEAPSAAELQDRSLILYAALSTTGIITVVPDLIGFGDSKSILHPYYVKEATVQAVVDNLKAAHQLAMQHELHFNKKLFLAGYSQGGYATMAAHQWLETNGLEGFQLTASFPAAGGYDVKGMQEYFFDLDTYDNPFYIAFVALAYRRHYQWSTPLSQIFNEPYASYIPELFDGSKSGEEINRLLTDNIADLIQPRLLKEIDSTSAFDYLANAFRDNSLTNWAPKVKMYMYHGTADSTVPFVNSDNTYKKLINNGASPRIVTLIPLVGHTHSTGVVPYIESFVPTLLAQ